MLKNYFSLVFILFLFSQNIINGQTNSDLWTKTSVLEKKSLQKTEAASHPKEFQVYDLNLQLLRDKLGKTSPIKGQKSPSGSLLTFPNANGILEKFNVFEASVMEEGLQQKYPDLRSYIGKSIDNPSTIIRFSFTPQGLHAIILNSGSTVYIDPYTANKRTYMVYLKKSLPEEAPIDCEVKELNRRSKNTQNKSQSTNDGLLRTFRLSVTATGEYSQYHLTNQGVSANTSNEKKKEIVLSSIVATMTRVNAVFERDIAITMVLIENNDKIIFLDPETDNLTNADKYALLNENQPIVDKAIGPDNYDIGHVFAASSFGGVAYVNSFCKSIKSRAVSGNYRPKGAYFEGVIIHEMGHQYGANHTFNNCEDYWIVTSTSVEPNCGGGSGSIMSYSVNYNEIYFHLVSRREIWNNIKNSCGTTDQINNHAPKLEILPNYNIPVSTPFILNAIASDSDGDHLTYTFQQLDTEPAPFPIEATATEGPAFSALPPDISSMRYFPDISTVIDGKLSNTWEVLPEVDRTMKFGITVRDNNINGGQTASIETEIFFKGNSGPFKVTSPSNMTWSPNTLQTIKWDVARTNIAPVNCSLVNILLSTDGGYTFPIILASNIPNNGSSLITVPDIITNNAKIKVESVDNIFYALNRGSLIIDPFGAKTNVPDNNFEQALIDLGYDDVLDDNVFTSNISNIAELDLSDKHIKELTGIEGFKSLLYLNCKNNRITALDVSQNIQLKYLKCNYNQIQSINISGNPELEILNCRNNQIQALNLSINSKLEVLNCLNNKLTDLDTSQNVALTTLYCNSNQITDLDLSNNKQLELLNCKKNRLVTLNMRNEVNSLITVFDATANPGLQCIEVDNPDLSKENWFYDLGLIFSEDCNYDAQTNIPDDNFELALIDLGYDDILDDFVLTLNISGITKLDLTGKNIKDLTGIEDFKNLRNLNCKNNQITSLDLSQNMQLKYLKCHYNKIQSLHINGNPELEILNCRNNQIQNLNIKNNAKLKVLNCLNNQIQDLDLGQNSALTTLYCNGNQITDLNLSKNKMLQLLNCKKNNLVSLFIQNEANSLITDFDATDNPALQCIQVDNTAWSIANWTQIDSWSGYSEDCNYPAEAKTALNMEKEVLSEPIVIYPNPVTDILNIDSGSLSLIKIEIYSILGQKIKELNSGIATIEISDLSNGVYLIRLYSQKGVIVRKIIKSE